MLPSIGNSGRLYEGDTLEVGGENKGASAFKYGLDYQINSSRKSLTLHSFAHVFFCIKTYWISPSVDMFILHSLVESKISDNLVVFRSVSTVV